MYVRNDWPQANRGGVPFEHVRRPTSVLHGRIPRSFPGRLVPKPEEGSVSGHSADADHHADRWVLR